MGQQITTGMTIALKGDLGTGKTTFVQGLAKGLGIPESYYITSPTFTIINEYNTANLTLCHLDLYRLGSTEELDYIGFEDLLDSRHVIVVEWPGLLEADHFSFDLEIRFTLNEQFHRHLELCPSNETAFNLLNRLPGCRD